MDELVPAVVFPPGEYLKEALEGRGWSQVEFADILGRTPKLVNEIILGKTAITPTTAKEIATALDTSAMLWLNLEAAYRLHSNQEPVPSAIARRAAIRRRVPLRQITARGWITSTNDPDDLMRRVEEFLEGPIDKPVAFTMAAKQTSYSEPLSIEQEVWLLRAKKLAETMQLPSYSRAKLLQAVDQMHEMLRSPDDAYEVPRLLAETGVRFVVVEKLPGLKIDGVCFWLKGDTQPVIAMPLTRDRIDNFWFVLRHEIEHVLNGDGKRGAFVIDNDLDQAPNISEQEQRANAAAGDFCVSQAKLDDFMKRKGPLLTDTNIRQFAHANGLHSGLVAGQIRMRLSKGPLGIEAWKRFSSHLAKIRHVVISTALVDGFGSIPRLAR